MTTILQIPIITSSSSNVLLYNRGKKHVYSSKFQQSTIRYSISSLETGFHGKRWSFLGGTNLYKDGGFRVKVMNIRKRRNRVILMSLNRGFGFNGGGGGGGGQDDGSTGRVLGNLAIAIGLTYLTMTGQLGWILDAIVSLWILAFLIPIVGFGVFLWWAGRDILQSSCPNCGNEFQILRSTINDESQMCPFCSQPFSGFVNS
ncbi:uncharacterized protein LOC124941907 [Impatiens glandulifera]|uniref:uncharacterized protein LOC124941907 n=1 Tax=Impatiens glandulifera TaxID=253017 RepID=UPI001FB19703|nr:uncharacterized protein LOC124941907 [Impatiens glandulifera]XP_047338243.1 uncharacterized protein LOC124941907 [Impatiens glandulifera]